MRTRPALQLTALALLGATGLTACHTTTPDRSTPTPGASTTDEDFSTDPLDPDGLGTDEGTDLPTPTDLPPLPQPDETDLDDTDDVVAIDPTSPTDRALWDLGQHGDPDGNSAQIALRFLIALQDGDELAAARQLTSIGQLYFSYKPRTSLDRIMDDVARNARLDTAGACDYAEQFNDQGVVVTCGQVNVVVHVRNDKQRRGVQLSDQNHDIYPGPHTHAYTNQTP